jgi:hypothetical protein
MAQLLLEAVARDDGAGAGRNTREGDMAAAPDDIEARDMTDEGAQ